MQEIHGCQRLHRPRAPQVPSVIGHLYRFSGDSHVSSCQSLAEIICPLTSTLAKISGLRGSCGSLLRVEIPLLVWNVGYSHCFIERNDAVLQARQTTACCVRYRPSTFKTAVVCPDGDRETWAALAEMCLNSHQRAASPAALRFRPGFVRIAQADPPGVRWATRRIYRSFGRLSQWSTTGGGRVLDSNYARDPRGNRIAVFDRCRVRGTTMASKDPSLRSKICQLAQE
jgi:hypothetical protein